MICALSAGDQRGSTAAVKSTFQGAAANVGRRLDILQDNLAGDVKKLTGRTDEYRLRVGSLRVLFMLEADLISVYRLSDRKEAYE